MSTDTPNLDTVAWGLEHLLDRTAADAERADDFLVRIEDQLQGALAGRLAGVCAAMGVPGADAFEVLTDFEMLPPGPEGDWAEVAALVDLGGRGELVLSLELYRVLEDEAPAGQAAFLAIRLLPSDAWDEEELATFAALLAEEAEDAPEATDDDETPEEPAEAADDLDDEGEDLALVVALEPGDAERLGQMAGELLDEWIETWKTVRGA